MLALAYYIFWIGISIVFYTYIGYGIVIFFLAKLKANTVPKVLRDSEWPATTLLIAAYNEEDFIEEKIKNTLELDYPAEKLSIYIVTDGSTDRTPELVRQYGRIEHFHEDARKGKIHAVTRIMKFIKTETVVFCDANTFLNPQAVKNIIRHYADEAVGGVAGEKRIFKKDDDNASGAGEGLYWKYESFLKQKDSEVYSVVGAAGELFSIRTGLYDDGLENMIIEDFYLSIKVAMKGYRFMYEPDAYASESASASVSEEWKRKVRICAGGFQAMLKLIPLLNPFRYGILSFQYVSHRVLRWTLAPLFLPFILISNVILLQTGLLFYQLSLLLQVSFYVLGAIGYYFQDKKVTIKGFFVPYYFVVMNLSVYFGLLRFMKGKQSAVWEKSKRAAA
jgi:cellulose synthase/poly-beta-1,6-N-acetylglucosamine synthase-like glycosyltransferase